MMRYILNFIQLETIYHDVTTEMMTSLITCFLYYDHFSKGVGGSVTYTYVSLIFFHTIFIMKITVIFSETDFKLIFI